MSVCTLSAKIKNFDFFDFVTKYYYVLHEIILNIFVKKFLRSFVCLFD